MMWGSSSQMFCPQDPFCLLKISGDPKELYVGYIYLYLLYLLLIVIIF